MRKSIIVTFLLALCLSVAGRVQAADEKTEVTMKMLSLRNALIAKDSAALSDLLTADATFGHTNGLIQTRAQLIRSVVSGEQDYKAIDPSDMNIRMYGTTGVVNIKLHIRMNYAGKPLELYMKGLYVWIKAGNDWQLTARQTVKADA